MFRARWLTATVVTTAALAVVTGGGMAWAGTATAGRHGYTQARLRHDLAAIRATGVSGVLAEVHMDNRVLRGTSGVADLAAGTPVPVDGYFRIGSNTKTFVAVVVLQLVAEHRLSLDDTVDRWLPGLVSGSGNDGGRITVRQLLNHTSGIFDTDGDILATVPTPDAFEQHRFDVYSLTDLVAMAMRHPPYFAPGTGWHYSNTNYMLAALIIKKATGHDWATEVGNRILNPLNLRHTFDAGTRTDLPDPHANGYAYLYDPNVPLDVTTMGMTWAAAGGSMISNAADLSRFWMAIGRGELLRPAQRAQMRQTISSPDSPYPGARYGLGIIWMPSSCGGGYWKHDGGVPGYSTINGVSEDGRRTVVISMSTMFMSDKADRAANALVDNVMCSRS